MALRKLYLSSFAVLLFTMLGSQAKSQNPKDPYPVLWQKVEDFVKKGLPQSALATIDKIYQKAKKEKNDAQVIKCLLYKNLLILGLTEDGQKKMIDTLQQEISTASGTEKAMLQNITAQLYQNYFSAHRYQLYSVTNTENFRKDDIATWSISDFQNKISELFLESLKEPSLKKISLKPFEAIIEKGNVSYLRPTLFDLLAHRALDYFKSSENDVTRPAYAFEIDNKSAFDIAAKFAKAKINSRDSTSLHLKALQIFQQLLAMHIHELKPLIDADIERLQFVYQYATMPDKDALYLKALKDVYSNYKDPEADRAGFLAGQLMYNKASQEKSAGLMKEAVDYLRQITVQSPNSDGSKEATNLLAQIEAPSLSLQSEKVNVPGIPFRTLVSFRNVNKMYLRILKVSKKQKEEINQIYPNEKRFERLRSLPLVREWEQSLPDPKDFLEHSAEINTGSLPFGEYIIVSSTNKSFNIGNNAMAALYVYVSNISFVNNGSNYFALNRTTGKPLANARILPWRNHYDYKSRKYLRTPQKTIFSDRNGYFNITNDEKLPGSIQLEITSGQDHLFLDDNQNLYTYNPYLVDEKEDYTNQNKYDEDKAKIFLFTDRSIYRPGQFVYFKGIGVTKNVATGKTQLLQYKNSITAYLINANDEEVDSIKVNLNEYGSFSGKFELPENQLTGRFEITTKEFNDGNVSFSVEEYKRPKFYVEFDKAKESYRVNDTVHIVGNANAYSGNNIDGAKVSYRVTRIPRFLYPWFFWRRGLPQTKSMEITHGETVTDVNGKFAISFAAIPDNSLGPKTEPVFDYKIQADVTDINGETRSTEITVPVGYKTLDLQIQLANKQVFIKDSLRTFTISANNLSGEPQTANAQLRIYKLSTPNRIMRDRLWAEPDTVVMSEEKFISLFPQDVYRDENMPEVWERNSLITDKTDTVKGSASFSIGKSLSAGWYVVEVASKDRYGNPVKDVKYFQVIDPKSGKNTIKDYFIVQQKVMSYQPGDVAHLLTGSASDIHLVQQLDKIQKDTSEKMPAFSFYNIHDEFVDMKFPIQEDDRGGFSIMQFFVKDNRFYSSKAFIDVPWRNKQLTISFDTYREKTLPGSKENWKVTVKGVDGQKVAAEMLASMYDASLDQFVAHQWRPMNIWPYHASYNNWSANQNFSILSSYQLFFPVKSIPVTARQYDRILYLSSGYKYFPAEGGIYIAREGVMDKAVLSAPSVSLQKKVSAAPPPESIGFASDSSSINMPSSAEKPSATNSGTQSLRTNFNETVFFYPELRTDEDGNISFSFTMPDALTKWRLMMQAHTKDLAIGYAEKSVVTQKDLMVMPNAPRFLREGDQMEFSAKVVNMTDHEVSGQTEFHLLNATTMNPVDQWFQNKTTSVPFTIPAKQSSLVTFNITIPKGFNDAVAYRIIAKTPEMSDGEEAFIPVVTNRMMVTESIPLHLQSTGTKRFNFEKLLKSGNSSTLTNYGLTVEYTPDPAWYAVQALPYLNAYPYECTEQVFNRYFANALAMHIANTAPRVKSIFEKWRIRDTAALMSNLQKNQELKSVLLEETPWVLQAKSESEQKRNIAMLFDLVNMSKQLGTALAIVKDRQTPNGGFSWFNSGPDDRYITQYILADMGHLKKLSGWPQKDAKLLESIASKAIVYLDARIKEDYENLKKLKVDLKKNQLTSIAIQYLYARSFFPENKISPEFQAAYTYYFGQAKKYWLDQSIYSQGMIALTLFRKGELSTAQAITKSLKENSILNDELGRYWKDWNRRGYWWYEAPIESQALMIEVFSEAANDQKVVGELKTWLLKNKQTNNWKTTKATSEAVYALLLQGDVPIEIGGLSETRNVKIDLGKTVFDNRNEVQEAGTGYFKRTIDGQNVKPDMGNITLTVSSPSKKESESPSWGAVYWQYFEDLDKITFAETPLKLAKKLFVEKNTDRGPVLTPINEGDQIHIGDKIKVRIELRVDRDMEYVHMKDMRASCMEPVNVLSSYKWQGGLGYYESTKDVSTNFFFSYLPKGTYVFEYPMFVTHAGDFSNGITTIQCMYAPEFTAHSEGVRVKVK